MIHFHHFDQMPERIFMSGENEKDSKILTLLELHLNKVPEFCYMPQFHGIPYKEEFLFSKFNKDGNKIYFCSIGLWQEIYKFFKANNAEFDGLKPEWFKRSDVPTFEDFKSIIDSWGLKFTPREYQYEAAWKTLHWKQSLSELCTRAGKTLIAYMIFRYMMEHQGVKKILMIVPSIALVKQGFNDFSEYAEFFKTNCVWGGAKKNDMVDSANLTIGTYQSLINKLKRGKDYNPHWFDQFDLVFVDEVHGAKASSIKTIISQPFFLKCKLVYGMTGTLPKEGTIDRYSLAALLGAKIQQIRAEQLQNEGYISDILVHQVKINYDINDTLWDYYISAGEYILSDYEYESVGRKKKKIPLETPEFLWKHKKSLPPGILIAKNRLPTKEAYATYLKDLIKSSDSTNFLQLERMVLHKLKARINILKDLIWDHVNDTGNWLILTHHTEYTDYVTSVIKESFPSKNVFSIKGDVTPKKREKIMADMKPGNAILVASYGCMSTGITLPDLRYGVLFESFKSEIVNVQSLGRGLGKTDGKDLYEVWDFVDLLPTKKIKSQGATREKIYKDQGYPHDSTKLRGVI